MAIHRCKLAVAFLLWSLMASGQTNITERLSVDATDAPRNILHATLTIPVTPGPVTIVYPKWIPGNHRPTGPIQNFTGLHFKAGGRELEWQRDLEDMYAFHLQIPAGVTELEASYDTITYNGKSSLASSKVLDLLWNQVVLVSQRSDHGFSAGDGVRASAGRLEVWHRAHAHAAERKFSGVSDGLAHAAGGFTADRRFNLPAGTDHSRR